MYRNVPIKTSLQVYTRRDNLIISGLKNAGRECGRQGNGDADREPVLQAVQILLA
jgi:hypothetical protein